MTHLDHVIFYSSAGVSLGWKFTQGFDSQSGCNNIYSDFYQEYVSFPAYLIPLETVPTDDNDHQYDSLEMPKWTNDHWLARL